MSQEAPPVRKNARGSITRSISCQNGDLRQLITSKLYIYIVNTCNTFNLKDHNKGLEMNFAVIKLEKPRNLSPNT